MLSIVVPTYHRNDLLNECLARIAPEVQQLDVPYEVIVSDDGRESTAQVLIAEKYSWATWVKGPQKGPASNRNNGARQTKYDWLVFLDDDCLPDDHLLRAYCEAIKQHPDLSVFEGKIYADRERQRFDEESPINLEGGKLWSCNFCIRKTTFEQLQGFDESFPHATMEDIDFKLRLIHAGETILFTPSAAVCHPWRRIKGWQMYKKRYASYQYLINKYPEKKKMHTPFSRVKILIGRLGKGIYSLAKCRFRGAHNLVYRTAIDVLLIFVK
jgi:GT2 family glycosyltransferase